LASAESRAHPHYKQRLLEADEGRTVRTILFGHGWPNAPHRTLRTAFVEQWLGREGRGQESRPDEPAVGQTVIGGQAMPVLRFVSMPPNGEASGDIDAMALLAGQGVGLVREIKPAGQIVHELVEEGRQIIAQGLLGLLQPAGAGGAEPPRGRSRPLRPGHAPRPGGGRPGQAQPEARSGSLAPTGQRLRGRDRHLLSFFPRLPMAGKVQKIDLASQAFARDPFPTYASLREVGPVFQTRLPLLGKTWVATTYQAASEVLKDDETFVMEAKKAGKTLFSGILQLLPRILRVFSDNMLAHDNPDHRRLRRLVEQAFSRH